MDDKKDTKADDLRLEEVELKDLESDGEASGGALGVRGEAKVYAAVGVKAASLPCDRLKDIR